MPDLKSVVNFLFETGMMAKTPRSGFHFLGSGRQSVAEHNNRVVFIGYVLSALEKNCASAKTMKLCLFHDLAETRTTDLNYVHQKYARTDEEKATDNLAPTLEFGGELKDLIREYNEKKTPESIIAHDADQLEFLLSLKEQIDIGNKRAETWIGAVVKRLKTASAVRLADEALKTNSDEWWFGNKDDQWWVDRNKK